MTLSSQCSPTGSDRPLGDQFDSLYGWSNVLFSGLVSAENVHCQVIVSTPGQGLHAVEENVVDTQLQKVE